MEPQKPNPLQNPVNNSNNSAPPNFTNSPNFGQLNNAQPVIEKPKKITLSLNNVKLPTSIKIAMLIFALSSALILSLIPRIAHNVHSANTPPFWLFLVSGLFMICFTALFFNALSRLNLGFGKSALILAFGYNSVIVVIKFVLSPAALYISNRHTAFSTLGDDPNSLMYYIITGVIILFLYAIVFRLVYAFIHKKLEAQLGGERFSIKLNPKLFLIFGAALFCTFFVGGGAILLIGYLFAASSLDYLSYIFGALGIPLLLAIVLAIAIGYQSFDAVSEEVQITGNITLLAGFFWIGLAMIFLYHILWIVFMITLVHIWPFNTYSPK